MSEVKQYAERDAMALDDAGGYYFRHVLAMTGEKLHSKGDIAAELGWRDMQIEQLKAERDALAIENVALKATVDAVIGVADNSDGIAGWHKNGELASWYELLPELDAEFRETDAFLNSVRAEGVEMLTAKLQAHISGGDFVGEEIAAISGAVDAGADIAAQLRAGKDGE